MRVVGLVSSPRKGGNSELAVKEILRSLPDDWEKVMIRLNELDIRFCNACYHCVPEGSKCVIQDDLDFLIRHVKHADKVVLGGPVYMLAGHAGIKMIQDRLLSITSDYPSFPNADCVAVTPYGMPAWEGMGKEAMILFARKLHLNLLGSSVMPATLPGDAVKGRNLDELHRLADLLVHGSESERPEPTSEALECPFCSSTALRIKPDGSIRCSVCNGEGTLEREGDQWKITFDPDFQNIFTPHFLDIHSQYLMDKKQLFLDTRTEVKAIQADYEDLDWWVRPEKKD